MEAHALCVAHAEALKALVAAMDASGAAWYPETLRLASKAVVAAATSSARCGVDNAAVLDPAVGGALALLIQVGRICWRFGGLALWWAEVLRMALRMAPMTLCVRACRTAYIRRSAPACWPWLHSRGQSAGALR